MHTTSKRHVTFSVSTVVFAFLAGCSSAPTAEGEAGTSSRLSSGSSTTSCYRNEDCNPGFHGDSWSNYDASLDNGTYCSRAGAGQSSNGTCKPLEPAGTACYSNDTTGISCASHLCDLADPSGGTCVDLKNPLGFHCASGNNFPAELYPGKGGVDPGNICFNAGLFCTRHPQTDGSDPDYTCEKRDTAEADGTSGEDSGDDPTDS